MFDKLLRAIESLAEKSILIIKQLFIQGGKNATGGTIDSLRIETNIDFNIGVEIDIYGSKVFDFINDGRPPGSKLPPQGALLSWMASKGIPEDKEFAIRKSIADNGIEPYPIIELSVMAIQREFNQNISNTIIQELTGIISTAISRGFKI